MSELPNFHTFLRDAVEALNALSAANPDGTMPEYTKLKILIHVYVLEATDLIEFVADNSTALLAELREMDK